MFIERKAGPQGSPQYRTEIAAQLGAAIFNSGLRDPHPLLSTARIILGAVNAPNPPADRVRDAEAVLIDLRIVGEPNYEPPTPHPLFSQEQAPRPTLTDSQRQAVIEQSIADASAAGYGPGTQNSVAAGLSFCTQPGATDMGWPATIQTCLNSQR